MMRVLLSCGRGCGGARLSSSMSVLIGAAAVSVGGSILHPLIGATMPARPRGGDSLGGLIDMIENTVSPFQVCLSFKTYI
jgi:hypothetical protein